METGAILRLAIFTLGVALCFLEISAATNYCSSSLCGGSNHIACNNNGALSSVCTSDAKLQTISADIQAAIINKHNALRNTIAKGSFSGFSPAARMATIKWSPELAQIAALNVKQCALRHDACRNTDQFKWAGQNLAYAGWSGISRTVQEVVLSGIDSWFNEYKDCTMTQINSYLNPLNGAVIGHFTQVVQDKATEVGCATLRQTKNGFTEQYTACNYAHTNILNRPVYVSSTKAATQCTTGVNPSYPSLCSINENIDANAV